MVEGFVVVVEVVVVVLHWIGKGTRSIVRHVTCVLVEFDTLWSARTSRDTLLLHLVKHWTRYIDIGPPCMPIGNIGLAPGCIIIIPGIMPGDIIGPRPMPRAECA